jgi:large subunit ribosomal protein L13e
MHHIKPVITAQSGKERLGKGFSPDELKEAGLTAADARNLKIPVDRKRRTSHEENIEALKAHYEKAQAAKPKTAAKPKEKKSKS